MQSSMGIPSRMARAVGAMFARDGAGRHDGKRKVLDAIMADDLRIPLADEEGVQTKPEAILCAADQAARECYAICARVQTVDGIIEALIAFCHMRGVGVPKGETMAEVIARATDRAWWNRQLRKEWLRRLEHTAIQLGLTYVRADPYISREAAIFQAGQNAANQKMLESRIATNEAGQSYSVAELAALGMSNKALRRGELMMRIRGFEEIADTLGDVALFFTVTCPSKYHSVGGTNRKYRGATPRDAQKYLVKLWARVRSALKREDIQPYGFRVAEPHTDGCPHWHMLFFVAKHQVERMAEIVRAYAMEEDGDEDGAEENRYKLVRIESGKGTAAGYIIKYIGKNIDGFGVGDHKAFEDGRTYIIETDMFGGQEMTASARVTYWAQVWGIRQFQQIGGAPIGVWRELRRIRAEAVQNAPQEIKDAHAACQKIESKDPAVAKQAEFAAYVWAQGGPTVGSHAAIKIAYKEVTIEGRYATYEAQKPVGVYLVHQPEAVYEGVHYTWTITDAGPRIGAAFDLPRTGVNNCTGAPHWARKNPIGNPIENKIFRPDFSAGRNFDRQGAPAAASADAKTFQRHRARASRIAASWHLEHLQDKYRDRHA